jgi:hypothetical protein
MAINEQTEPAIIEQVEIIETASDYSGGDTALQITPLSELELLKRENAALQARIEFIENKASSKYDNHETVRLTFNGLGKRQGVWLKGYLVNALMLAAGIDKKDVSAWLSGCEFDSDKAITEQVKLLIVRELESELNKARG